MRFDAAVEDADADTASVPTATAPASGPTAGWLDVRGPDGEITIEQDEAGDLCGHGTACAGIVRSLAPECDLFSVRVLGAGYSGSGEILVAGLRVAGPPDSPAPRG